ncbi:hypothetical protein G9A89_011561 [Geosiphon pyriformis]|nr:hypothetical protein G9A89_011561 [Geosiphon pyriformis]
MEQQDQQNRHNNSTNGPAREEGNYRYHYRGGAGRGGQHGRGGRGKRYFSQPQNFPIENPLAGAAARLRAKLEANSEEEDSFSSKEICHICAMRIQYYAVADCNHRTCHTCSLRLRALWKTKDCVFCKTVQLHVIFTSDPEKPYQDYKLSEIQFIDEKLNISCETEQMFEDTMIILRYNCPDPRCEVFCEGGWAALKRHCKQVHNKFLCNICIQHKRIFAHEQSLFTKNQLERHHREGDQYDQSGFKGHPECEFCQQSFYGDDELYEHCRDRHQQCEICKRRGIRHQYYVDADALAEHFSQDHFVCNDPECLAQKVIVFETDIDLKAHEVEIHGSSLAGQRAKHEARRIEINFSYGDSHARARGRRRSREREIHQQTGGTSGRQSVPSTIQTTTQVQRFRLEAENRRDWMLQNAPEGFGRLTHEDVSLKPSSPTGPRPTDPQEPLDLGFSSAITPIVNELRPAAQRKSDFPSLNARNQAANSQASTSAAHIYSNVAKAMPHNQAKRQEMTSFGSPSNHNIDHKQNEKPFSTLPNAGKGKKQEKLITDVSYTFDIGQNKQERISPATTISTNSENKKKGKYSLIMPGANNDGNQDKENGSFVIPETDNAIIKKQEKAIKVLPHANAEGENKARMMPPTVHSNISSTPQSKSKAESIETGNASTKGKANTSIAPMPTPVKPPVIVGYNAAVAGDKSKKSQVTPNNDILSRHNIYLQRITAFLNNDQQKILEFKSLTSALKKTFIDTFDYVDGVWNLFGKNPAIVGKVVSGLADLLDAELSRTLLRAWEDRKALPTTQFPALEIGVAATKSSTSNAQANKPPRVLVIKSSTARSTASGSRDVWDKVANAASRKNNVNFPSLQAAAASSDFTSNVWKGNAPQFVRYQSSSSKITPNISQFESPASFRRGKPANLPQSTDEFPSLIAKQANADASMSIGAWRQANHEASSGEQSSISDDEQASELTKKQKRKMKKQKQKNLLLHLGAARSDANII